MAAPRSGREGCLASGTQSAVEGFCGSSGRKVKFRRELKDDTV